MAKWGWALRFSDPGEDIDYSECMEQPYDTEQEARDAAEQADSDRHLGCGVMNAYAPDEHPERPEDLEDAQIEVFRVD